MEGAGAVGCMLLGNDKLPMQEDRMALAVRPPARAYNRAVLAWLLLLLLLWAAGLLSLERSGRLPAPPITATHCIDEKFKFLRKTDLSMITLLAVGSSVTHHSLDAGALRRHYGPAVKPINAAPCYLRINQIAFLTKFYLAHMPRVNTVLSVLAMRDFSDCASNPAEFFDANEAAAYIFERRSPWYLYFKNFRPVPFLRFVLDPPILENMDQYGWSPKELQPDPRENVIVDETCFTHLRELSHTLAARDINFVGVLLPPMPAWLHKYDPQGVRDRAFRAAVASHVYPQRTVLIDAAQGLELTDQDFTDPAHIHAASVPTFMRYLLHELEKREVPGTPPQSGGDDAL
ncbi:MAG: hypothetical protein ACREV1_00480 [Gammaproteobacteria bacterium]